MTKTKSLTVLVLALFSLNVTPAFRPERAFCEDGTEGEVVLAVSEEPGQISMNFDGALLKDVLTIFSQQSGLNFVSSEEVETKKVTVYFENVPVQDALDALIKANNLRYEKKEGSKIFIVYPSDTKGPQLYTRVFHLKYARLSTSPVDVGGKKTITDLKKTISTAGSDDGSSGSEEGGGQEQEESTEDELKKGIDEVIKSLVTAQGKVAADIFTNTLIVTDTLEKLNEIEKIIQQIDVPSPQVILEVHIMEVRKDLLKDHGVEWGGSDGAMFTFTAGNKTTTFPYNAIDFQNRDPMRVLSNTIAASTSNTVPSYTLGSISGTDFKAILHFITTQSDTKVLAKPRVLTQNNEAANIQLVTNAAIADQTTTTSGTNISTTTTHTAERFNIGINLKMTPQINEEEQMVSLFLEPAIVTATTSSLFPSTFLDPTIRSIRTIARVRHDETLVIGGLIDSNRSTVNKKLPVLGDLPFIGQAFRYDEVDNADRELLIFITPRIVSSDRTPKKMSHTDKLAMRRMVNAFSDQEMELTMTPFQEAEMKKNIVPLREKELIRLNRPAVGPKVDSEMAMALESYTRENKGVESTEVMTQPSAPILPKNNKHQLGL